MAGNLPNEEAHVCADNCACALAFSERTGAVSNIKHKSMTEVRADAAIDTSSDEAIALLRARLSGRKRSRLIVEIDLDPVPGWGNVAADHARYIQHLLDDVIGHYHPSVEVAP